MNDSHYPPTLPVDAVSGFSRFRYSTLFELSRSFPKLLALRSTPGVWTSFRALLGAVGVALVVLPLSLWNVWQVAPVGLVLFLLAVLLPPTRQNRGTAEAIRRLGADLVLDGGQITRGEIPLENGRPCGVNLYLTKTRVWALDEQLRPVAIIPGDEIESVTVYPDGRDWLLRLTWRHLSLAFSLEFTFAGLFAERRARLAEQGLSDAFSLPERAPAKASALNAEVELAYQEWAAAFKAVQGSRLVLVRPWPRRTNLLHGLFRGAATTASLFPNTFRNEPRCNHSRYSGEKPEHDALADDWYNVGRDLYAALRKRPDYTASGEPVGLDGVDHVGAMKRA